ncbi:MAG: hypothetical protein WD595_02835 [Waddliaceae bacterium]
MSFIIGSSESPYYSVECSLVATIDDCHKAKEKDENRLEDRYTSTVLKDKVTSKIVKTSWFDRLCWVPLLSTVTGGIRALGAIFHIIWSLLKFSWHSARGVSVSQNKREIAFGFRQLGLGLLEAIPILGNAIAYLLYINRKNHMKEHAQNSLRAFIPIGKYSEEKENYSRLVQEKMKLLGDGTIEKEKLYDQSLFQHIQEPENFQNWLDQSEEGHIEISDAVKELTKLYRPTYFLHTIFNFHSDTTQESHAKVNVLSI